MTIDCLYINAVMRDEVAKAYFIGRLQGAAILVVLSIFAFVIFMPSMQGQVENEEKIKETTCKVQMQFGAAQTHEYTGKIQRAKLN